MHVSLIAYICDLNFLITFDRIDIYQVGLFSLLIRAARQVGSEGFFCYGQEMNVSTWALCKMNMLSIL